MKKDIDGHQYEYECANILKHRGFSHVTVTKGSGDQGIDVIAYNDGKKYGIQCKYYASPVGNKAVQEAYAGAKFYNCDVAAVMTNTTFTLSAKELASKTGVELWPNNSTKMVRPISISATTFVGILAILFGLLCLWASVGFDGIPYRFLQIVLALCILLSGVFNVLQERIKVAGLWATVSYAMAFILELIVSFLCGNTLGIDSCVFGILSAFSFICMRKTKRKNSTVKTTAYDDDL